MAAHIDNPERKHSHRKPEQNGTSRAPELGVLATPDDQLDILV
jgi:hypothetical protein